MIKIINDFTNIEYECIKFNGENYTEVYNFIKENLNIPVACVKDKNIINAFGLEDDNIITTIEINDYVIRTLNHEFYNVIDTEIFNNNFKSE